MADLISPSRGLPLAVGQLPMNLGSVSGRHFDLFAEAAHALGFLGSEQVALAGMMAHDFAGKRELEALGGATMRFQFYLCSGFSGHSIPRMNF